MASIKTIIQEVDAVENLQNLTVVYEEIAVMRIGREKSKVLQTRTFLEKLSHVFYDIKASYALQLLAALQGKKNISPLELSGTKKNGKEAHVLLSSNEKLYGDIISLVFTNFIEKTHTLTDVDIIIIGSVGKTLFEEKEAGKQYSYLPLSDTVVNDEQIRPIMEKLLDYEKVFIYYGKFQSVLSQLPQVANISGNQPFEGEQPAQKDQERYLFEPTITSIVSIFETQIFYALFKQTLSEIELARFASRVKAMEKTNENIAIRMKKLQKAQRRMKAWESNRRQLSQESHMLYIQKRRTINAKG